MKIFIAIIIFSTIIGCDSPTPEAPKPSPAKVIEEHAWELQYLHDDKHGVMCYRFETQSGIFCLPDSALKKEEFK